MYILINMNIWNYLMMDMYWFISSIARFFIFCKWTSRPQMTRSVHTGSCDSIVYCWLNAFSGQWGVKGIMDTMLLECWRWDRFVRCFKLDNTTLPSVDTFNFHQNNSRLSWIELLPYGALISNNHWTACCLSTLNTFEPLSKEVPYRIIPEHEVIIRPETPRRSRGVCG